MVTNTHHFVAASGSLTVTGLCSFIAELCGGKGVVASTPQKCLPRSSMASPRRELCCRGLRRRPEAAASGACGGMPSTWLHGLLVPPHITSPDHWRWSCFWIICSSWEGGSCQVGSKRFYHKHWPRLRACSFLARPWRRCGRG